MWQSRVEIEDYSAVYLDRIAVFEVPYRWTSIKGRAHMHFVTLLDIHPSTKHIWALPPPKESSGIWCFKHGEAIKIRDRIFDFYMGLSHVCE